MPRGTRIRGVPDQSAGADRPAVTRVGEVDGVEVFARRRERRRPACAVGGVEQRRLRRALGPGEQALQHAGRPATDAPRLGRADHVDTADQLPAGTAGRPGDPVVHARHGGVTDGAETSRACGGDPCELRGAGHTRSPGGAVVVADEYSADIHPAGRVVNRSHRIDVVVARDDIPDRVGEVDPGVPPGATAVGRGVDPREPARPVASPDGGPYLALGSDGERDDIRDLERASGPAGPSPSAVGRRQDETVRAARVAVLRVGERDGQDVARHARLLTGPRLPAVGGVQDESAPADRPSLPVAGEGEVTDRASRHGLLRGPGRAAI